MPTSSFSSRLHYLQMRTAFICATTVAGASALFSPSPAQAGWRSNAAEQDVILRPIDQRNCVEMGGEDLKRLLPLEQLINKLAELPLTGTYLAAMVNDPAQKQVVCTTEQDLEGASGVHTYELRVTVVQSGLVTQETILHEFFHAGQGMRGGLLSANAPVSSQDRAMSTLLAEATAKVYPLLVFAEAQLQGNSLPTVSDLKLFKGSQFQEEFYRDMIASYETNRDLDEKERRQQSLQSAGRAAVDKILSGGFAEWSEAYAPRAIKAAYLADSASAKTGSRRYHRQRDELFTRAGYVGSQINITPVRFLGPGADAEIEKALAANGVAVVRVPKPEFQFGQRR